TGLGVTTPVQRVALRPGPSASGPDEPVAMNPFGDFGGRTIVSKREQVVLVPTRLARMIDTIQGSGLPEVDLDGRNALFEQPRELGLIPRDRFGMREVEHGIFAGQLTAGSF